MDHPAALHRLTVGVPATVEHSSEATEGGSEIAKWVAETTSVCPLIPFPHASHFPIPWARAGRN
jgi:hypothetical protein